MGLTLMLRLGNSGVCRASGAFNSWNPHLSASVAFLLRDVHRLRFDKMSSAPVAPLYEALLVPALQRIQHEFGYLKQEEIERYSADTGTPQYRLWAVASFFPHFQLTP